MIVYSAEQRSIELEVAAARVLAAANDARRDPRRGKFQNLLIEFGEFESGVTDVLSPNEDRCDAVTQLLRRAGLSTGRLLYRSWRSLPINVDAELNAIERAIAELSLPRLPRWIPKPVSEGYAFYGLYPETYLLSAEGAIGASPRPVVCIGIRSIGVSLSSAVCAVAEHQGSAFQSATVRPRGHPFHRTLSLSSELEREIQQWSDADFWIVDEGPGLSGSSFACVVLCLEQLGVRRDRITLMPSWLPEPEQLRSETARRAWALTPKVSATFEETWVDSGRLAREFHCTSMQDIAGGKWRSVVYATSGEWPAVHPQHEARKYLCTVRGSSSQYLLKFEGLAQYGLEKWERARSLATSGFCAPPIDFSDGFVLTKFTAGAPLTPRHAEPALLDNLALYLAEVHASFRASESTAFHTFMDMIRVNTCEAIGSEALDAVESLLDFRHAVTESPATAMDGRMLPHEWIETSGGILKTDALDHHSDHFFPGCTDIAWDLAGTMVEFDLDTDAAAYFLRRFAHYSGDATLDERLPFYLCAYTAFRLGYVTMCAHFMPDSPDRDRFRRAIPRYRSALESALYQASRHSSPAPCLLI